MCFIFSVPLGNVLVSMFKQAVVCFHIYSDSVFLLHNLQINQPCTFMCHWYKLTGHSADLLGKLPCFQPVKCRLLSLCITLLQSVIYLAFAHVLNHISSLILSFLYSLWYLIQD